MSDSKKIPIVNKKTGQVSSGQSVRSQMPSKENPIVDNLYSTDNSITVVEPNNIETSAEVSGAQKDEESSNKKSKAQKKQSKQEINSLSEYVEYAYSRKGQGISSAFKKAENLICKDYLVSPEKMDFLLNLAKKDTLLSVPRQLLLVSKDIAGHPRVKTEIRGFVENALKSHFIFSDNELTAALNNLPDAISPQEALNKIRQLGLSGAEKLSDEHSLKSSDQELLISNAINCLAVWFVESRGYTIEQLANMLNLSLWGPSITELTDDIARMRALTSIQDVEGVGLVCSIYKKATDKHVNAALAAEQKQKNLSEKISTLESELNLVRQEHLKTQEHARVLLETLETERESHAHARVHLGDDKEQLRSRLLRRLKNEASLLEEGLHALRREQPKIHVMEDHAERALEGIYKGIKELESED